MPQIPHLEGEPRISRIDTNFLFAIGAKLDLFTTYFENQGLQQAVVAAGRKEADFAIKPNSALLLRGYHVRHPVEPREPVSRFNGFCPRAKTGHHHPPRFFRCACAWAAAWAFSNIVWWPDVSGPTRDTAPNQWAIHRSSACHIPTTRPRSRPAIRAPSGR